MTSQRRRANLAPMVAARTRINTASAAQTPRTPQSPATATPSMRAQAAKAATMEPAIYGPSLAPIRTTTTAAPVVVEPFAVGPLGSE